jgi:hypothetical protein
MSNVIPVSQQPATVNRAIRSNDSGSFRADINGLRALAVVIVVLFHFKIRGFEGGFIGVDVFFVISGYLMTKIIVTRLDRYRFNYVQFVLERAARIGPVLIVVVMTLLVLGFALLPPLDYEALGREVMAATLFYSNVHYRNGTGYFAIAPDERWLLHTWSLSIEWQFYILYPLILSAVFWAVGHITGKPARRRHLVIAVLMLCIVSLLTSAEATERKADYAYFMLEARAWEMMAGGLVFLFEPRLQQLPAAWRTICQVVGLAGLFIVIYLAGKDAWEAHWPGLIALGPVLATCSVLVAGAGAGAPMPSWTKFKVIRSIGLWSYSIYLWHWPLVVLLNFVEIDNASKRFAKLAGMTTAILLGWLSFRFIESRCKIGREPSWAHPVMRACGVGVIGSFGVATLVASSDGVMQRVRQDRRLYEQYSELKLEKKMPVSCGNYKKPPQELQLCAINPSADGPRVLVYGDSHAQHLYPWFDAHAQSRVDFFVSVGCPPAPGFNRFGPGFRCREYVDAALARAGSPEYSTVIVAGNWGNGMDQVPSTLCATDGIGCGSDGPATRAALVKANVDAWRRLLAQGKTLVIIDQSPVAGFDVFNTTVRRHFLGLPVVEKFEPIRPPGAGDERYIDSVMNAFLDGTKPVVLRLGQLFCQQDLCNTVDSATRLPILIDTSHFSAKWIREHGYGLSEYVKTDLPQNITSAEILSR